MYGAGHLLSSHKEINEPALFAIYLNSPYLTLLPRAMGSYLKWRLAAPLHGRLTPPRFSPSCPNCLSLWLGRSIIVPRWNLCETVCHRPLSGPMGPLVPYWPSLVAKHQNFRILRILSLLRSSFPLQVVIAHLPLSLAPRLGAPSRNVFQ